MKAIRSAFRIFVVLYTLRILTPAAVGQGENPVTARQAVYFELFGQGLLYSLNYDYRVTHDVSVRTGFTSWTVHGFLFNDISITGFPLMANYLTGRETHHLELGIGIIPMSVRTRGFLGFNTGESHRWQVLGTATIGYRAQSADGGMVFRIGLTPFFTFEQVGLHGGVSIGVGF